MITSSQYQAYSQSLSQLSERAQERFEADMKKVAGKSIDIQVEAAKHSLKTINAYYGDMAATVSAEWFEALGEQQAGKVYDAVLAETWPDYKIEGSVDYARRHLEDGKPEKFESYLKGTTDKAVKQAGRDTIVQSCKRYERQGVRYARVPQGPTCPFCIMLASRGFIYHSEDTAGEFEKFHSHCDCEIVPSWEKSPRVEGYDPEKMYERYLMCRDTLDKDWVEKTYRELPVVERAGMTLADFERKHILAEMGTRDREWLYSGKNPPVNYDPEWVEWERKAADALACNGFSIEYIERSVFERKPDFFLNGEKWEMKNPENPGYMPIWNQFKSAVCGKKTRNIRNPQSDKLVISNVRSNEDLDSMAAHVLAVADDEIDTFPEIKEVLLVSAQGARRIKR